MKTNLLVHKHLIVRAESKKPITSEEKAVTWMKELIASLNMKVFIGPYAKYCSMEGNKGLTVMAVIETSHIVMHVWDEPNPALIQLDKIEYKYLNRETGLTDISQGIMNYK